MAPGLTAGTSSTVADREPVGLFWKGGVVGHTRIKLAAWFLIALPAAIGFFYVRLFGVNVVYGDEWRLVNLFRKLHAGTLTFSAFWAQLNEHRIVVPKIVILTLGTLTRFDTVAEMYATQVLLLVALIIMYLTFRTRFSTEWLTLLFAPVAFLVFNLRQAEVMLMGLLMQFALVSAFAVLSFYCLDRARRGVAGFAFLGALASATLASLSAAQGLLVWPAGLAQVIVGPGLSTKKASVAAVWILAGASVWAAYFSGWRVPRNTAALVAESGPLYLIRFFLTAMGAPLSWWQGPALATGAVLLALVAAGIFLAVRSGRLADHSFWIALLCFAFLVLLALAYARSGRGIGDALVSRYTAYSTLGIVGLYGMLAKLALDTRSRLTTTLVGALLLVVALSLPASYMGGLGAGANQRAVTEEAARILADYPYQSDAALKILNPNPELVRKRAPILRRLGLNVFSERETRLR